MKKLFFLVLTVLIVACSSDDDNTCNVSDASLVGTWVGTADDDDGSGPYTVTLVFNDNGTGSIDESDSDISPFDYTSNDSLITLSIIGIDIITLNYEFDTCDQVSIYESPDPGEEADILVLTRQ
ncbi:hypothetical protein OAN97_01310 [Flavobacteriaceae bacterium]|jgi:hypothetical protein|nr:hypothetical protein [bacterium]MDB9913172.1 hypothetical protein [Flavobacteriaceae bacterium]MDB9993981.1 hypothetical protein [Flavobacteriaceae bacterium]MDC0539112.1 hypothetical protein [Flavobacteriaceae bacterium]|tara:strand:- start:499 stop:870 length:372 start_codon:yes stop_codon:yes gene_type:complete